METQFSYSTPKEETNPDLLHTKDTSYRSSKHLTLASPIFKAMLRNTFSEGTTLLTIGQVKVSLPEDDPTVMTNLVFLIHGRHGHPDIDHVITLDSLNKAAILVDKYHMHEAVAFFTTTWTLSYFNRHAIRLHSFRDFPLLFCVSWVFELEEPFKEITRIIQYNTVGSIKDMMKGTGIDLPIPEGVIGKYISYPLFRRSTNTSLPEKLETARLAAIGDTIQVLANLIAKYQDNNGITMCKVDGNQLPDINQLHIHKDRCDATVLGSLMRGATKEGLWPPALTESLRNSSVYAVKQKVVGVEFTTGCEGLRDLLPWPQRYDPYRILSSHGIRDQMRVSIEEAEGRLRGLDLKVERERFVGPLLARYR
ncbi:hypothetical protein SBOR_0464 [Sclerotinia borealis F-4128]|uniref:BTB domain-containing protein n=1 Tax=Sclerotinia borealis (strain F-4128) TaxID=1432307 RepID=W9CSN8_SCLBF|nr:hypothetical protein SBOR_0464 [Sclerotinia borealis F-4128]